MAREKGEEAVKFVCLLEVLCKLRLLSLPGLFRLFASMLRHGVNVMILLQLAKKRAGHQIALVDDREALTYRQLLTSSERLSIVLRRRYGLTGGMKVGFLCNNHAALVQSIFAVSQTGADLYLLPTEVSRRQFAQWVNEHDFDLLIHDAVFTDWVEQSYTKVRVYSYHDHLPAISNMLHRSDWEGDGPRRTSSGRIMLLTSGTTGTAKKVAHKPTLLHYLPPFSALLSRLPLLSSRTAYIATPIFHGYGIALLFLWIALGKKIVLTSGFDAAKACELVQKHDVEVISVVPLMLHKMLRHDACALKSLTCIASGGAELSAKLARDVLSKLGGVLYNLYGTSEAGLLLVATPADLHRSGSTVGRKIKGVRLHVLDAHKKKAAVGQVGQLCLKKSGLLAKRKQQWIETGDLGYRDSRGYYFLSGRVDEMIVSAGENVYPSELEHVLARHPFIEDVAVVGIRDEVFGQRLKAIVQLAPNAVLTQEALMEWLRPQVARYHMPKEIVFVPQMSYTHLGKRDKKRLKEWKAKEAPVE
ncbi:AMP-binding protein [Brevibacillus choshinensis]|uniref:AMP-binding protein n=1 Tax=Brevibacillus choshinensis TaxID=54911 RepID=UPI001EEF6E31|nr:AMP-binding protein [Brevibacillus choshinensis]